METLPGGEGISVLDTDLEVDFAAPVGYVEPERPKAAPPSTMASKLNIDLSSSTPGSSRPASSMGGTFAGTSKAATGLSKGGDHWESFKGKGETLGGRKTKGRGISHRQAEAVPEGSKIIRTDQHRVISNEDLITESKVPAPLNLPFGKLFFGFNIQPYEPPQSEPESAPEPSTFTGGGSTLSGRQAVQPQPPSSAKGKGKEEKPEGEAKWGTGGQALGARSSASTNSRSVGSGQMGAGGASVPRPPQRSARQERSPSPEEDWGVDDDDVIVIDSD